MYKCNHCKRYFEKYRIEKEWTGQDNQVGEVEFYYCPYCDSDDYEKVNDDEFKKYEYKRIYQREYRKKNSEKLKEYRKQYYAKNKEKIIERNNEYKAKDPEKWRAYTREYNKKHPEYTKKSYENFKKNHDWVAYCKESRDKRADKMREEGILNPYNVMNKTGTPRYADGSNDEE